MSYHHVPGLGALPMTSLPFNALQKPAATPTPAPAVTGVPQGLVNMLADGLLALGQSMGEGDASKRQILVSATLLKALRPNQTGTLDPEKVKAALSVIVITIAQPSSRPYMPPTQIQLRDYVDHWLASSGMPKISTVLADISAGKYSPAPAPTAALPFGHRLSPGAVLKQPGVTAPPSVAVSPPGAALPSNLDVETGWAAYQARPTKSVDLTPMDRPTFNRLWALLTDAEKQAAVRWYGYSMDQATAKMNDPATQQDPAVVGFIGKSMSVMMGPAAAPPPNAAPPVSTFVDDQYGPPHPASVEYGPPPPAPTTSTPGPITSVTTADLAPPAPAGASAAHPELGPLGVPWLYIGIGGLGVAAVGGWMMMSPTRAAAPTPNRRVKRNRRGSRKAKQRRGSKRKVG